AVAASFGAAQTFATSIISSNLVMVADVNGDFRPDLVVLNKNQFFQNASVSVLLNTTAAGATAPSFAAGQSIATSTPYSSALAVADVNGDGRPDLVITTIANSPYNGAALVLLNTTPTGATTPSFAAQQNFGVGRKPLSVAVADVNGDGRPDLIA